MANINKINQVIDEFFKKNKEIEKVRAKDLMQDFIQAGVFKEDRKNGLPIREVLRELDDKGELYLIPAVFPERKQVNTNWYFVRI